MGKLFGRIGDWFKKLDKDDLGKWGLLALAGGAGLAADYFDHKKKDRLYMEEMRKSVKEQAEKLLGGGDKEA